MRITRIVVLLLSLALPAMGAEPVPPPGGGEADPPPLCLREAVRRGFVEARGVKPRSYRAVTLELANRTDRPLSVNLIGSYLRPRLRGSCQRLGLGPPIDPRATKRRGPGTVVVDLGPLQKRKVDLRTVCLDAGRSAPGTQVFVPARDALPEVRQKVLEWWADHPDAPQGAVNAAVWQYRATVHVGPGTVERYSRPRGSIPALYGGTCYMLVDGELTALDPDGVMRILGTEIFQVIPTAEGVYAVALGEKRRPELWRLAMTGRRPWRRVLALDPSVRLLDVFPARDGNLVLVTDQGVRFYRRKDGSVRLALHTEMMFDISLSLARRGRFLAALKQPGYGGYARHGELEGAHSAYFSLYDLDGRTGTAKRIKRYWNVKAMRTGPAGTYGLSHRGKLRKLVRSKFRDLPVTENYRRILAVGGKVLWLVREDGRLALADAKTGRTRQLFGPLIRENTVLDVDQVTDDLAWVDGGLFRRIRVADGEVQTIR